MPDSFDPYHVWLGIPPDEQPPNHYRLLGVRKFEDNADVISNALDQRTTYLRTFQIGKRGAESQRLLNEVTSAGVCLLDRTKREQYDRSLRDAKVMPVVGESTAPPLASGLAPPPIPLAGEPPLSAIPLPEVPQPVPVVLEPAPAPAFAPVVAANVAGSSTAHRRAQSWLPLALAGSGAAAILLTVAVAGWWLWGRTPEVPGSTAQASAGPTVSSDDSTRANQPVAPDPMTNSVPPQKSAPTDKSTASNGAQTQSYQAQIDAMIAARNARKKMASGTSVPRENRASAGTPKSSPAANPPSAAKAPDASKQEAWVSEPEPTLTFHRVAGKWIELRSTTEYWFDEVLASTPEYVELQDLQRGVFVRLYADRVELKSAQQDWAIWRAGHWCAVKELPPMVRRVPTQATQDADSYPSNAVAFGGSAKMELPVPKQLKGAADSFTIEMWIRWNRYFPGRELLSLDGERSLLTTHRSFQDSGQTDIALKMPHLSDRWHASTPAGRWTHLALVRSGNVMRLFLNGKQVQEEALPAGFALGGSYLVLGSESNGLCGLVRDFHISGTALYRESFTPPLVFVRGPQTLALPNLRGPIRSNLIQDQSVHANNAHVQDVQWVRLTGELQIRGEKPDGSLDLMQAYYAGMDTPADIRMSTNQRRIETRSSTRIASASVPLCPPAEYEISATIQRQSGTGGAFLGLSIAGRPAILVIDAFPVKSLGGSNNRNSREPGSPDEVAMTRIGLLPGNLVQAAAASKLRGTPPVLPRGRAVAVKVKVGLVGTDRYSVAVSINGSQPLTFEGRLAELSIPPEFRQPGFASLTFGSIDAAMEYTEVVLRPLSDSLPRELLEGMSELYAAHTLAAEKTAAPIAGASPTGSPVLAPPPAASTPLVVRNAGEVERRTASRLPLPSAEQMAAKMAVAREIYEADHKQATTPQAKRDLAREIQQAAMTTTNDDAAKYVLYDLARKIALQAGDVDLALSVASQIDREFEVPTRQTTLATMKELTGGTLALTQRTQLATSAANLATDLVAKREFVLAGEAIALAVQAAASLRDAALRRTILQQRERIDTILEQYAAIEANLKTLAADPSDPEANLAAGKFSSLVLEDWPQGLPLLALSGESPFAQPAKLDLESRGNAAQQAEAAEAWLQLADSPHVYIPAHKVALKRRAKQLYAEAIGGLSGLDRVRAEKRLESLQNL
jgi:hypothetical protein